MRVNHPSDLGMGRSAAGESRSSSTSAGGTNFANERTLVDEAVVAYRRGTCRLVQVKTIKTMASEKSSV